jgi:integrase
MPRPDVPPRTSASVPASIEAPGRWRTRSSGPRASAATGAGTVRLGAYVTEHLARKRASRACSPRWLRCVETHLEAAVDVLGSGIALEAVGLRDIERFLSHLLGRPNGRGGTLSAGTIDHYLNSLSHLFHRAELDGLVDRNPVAQLLDRPRPTPKATPWLEVPEVAALLDQARRATPRRPDLAMPFLFELVAFFSYTGLRKAEGLGTRTADLHLDRGVLRVRPNRWRGLKTGESERVLPIFGELRLILQAYLTGPYAPTGDLLFPSPVGDVERPLTNLRRSLGPLPMPARLGDGVGGDPPKLGTRILRHSYCAARLQTLDHGAPISPYTVARELGHTDLSMVLRIYGHLGTIRCRHEEVRFLRPGSAADGAWTPNGLPEGAPHDT